MAVDLPLEISIQPPDDKPVDFKNPTEYDKLKVDIQKDVSIVDVLYDL